MCPEELPPTKVWLSGPRKPAHTAAPSGSGAKSELGLGL